MPLFRQQIKEGGPLTVTSADATRYFMTISEAAQLVIQAGAMNLTDGRGDCSAPVFLLDMGEPVKIFDLAVRMIELSGLTVRNQHQQPDGDVEIKFIGLRPGEKLHEELLIGEAVSKTSHPKIQQAGENTADYEKLWERISDLEKNVLNGDECSALEILGEMFDGLKSRMSV